MACSDYSEYYEFWSNLQFFDAVNCYYEGTAGGPTSAHLLIFGFLGLSLYAYSRNPLVVVVLGIFMGGLVIAPLPAAVVNAFTIVGVLVTAGILFLMGRKAQGGPFG